MEEWEHVELTWYGRWAVLDNVLLAGGKGVYGLPSWDGTEAGVLNFFCDHNVGFATPIPAGVPVLRHRACPEFLRTKDACYYLPAVGDDLLFTHRCRPLIPVRFRFAQGLQALGNGYYRDSEHAWYFDEFSEHRLENVRLSAFCAVQDHLSGASIFATDGIGLWKRGQWIAQAGSSCQATNHPDYIVLNGQVCWTKYGQCSPLHQKNGKPLAIDFPERFHMLDWRWGTDGRSVIIQAQSGSAMVTPYFCRIDGVDLDTFQVLNERYAMDAKRAYYINGKVIRYCGRFRIVEKNKTQFDANGRVVQRRKEMDGYFAVDDLHVYAAGAKLAGADGASFEHLEFDLYRDRNHVYRNKKKLDVDAASFIVTQLEMGDEKFSPALVGDKNGPLDSRGITELQVQQWAPFFSTHPDLQGYWWHRYTAPACNQAKSQVRYGEFVFEGLDPDSFQVVALPLALAKGSLPSYGTNLCGDKDAIYTMQNWQSTCALSMVSKRPISSLRVVGPCYFTDGESVFYLAVSYNTPTVLRQADPATFAILEGGWSRDATHSYYLDVLKKDFPPDRVQIHGSYAWTDQHLLCDGKPFVVEVPHSELKTPHRSFLVAGKKLFYGRRPVSTARVHLPSLEFLDDWFAKDMHHIYTIESTGLVAIEAVDRNTFELLGDGRAKDGNRHYDALPFRL